MEPSKPLIDQTYCKEKGHDVSMCSQVIYLKEECATLFAILTKEQSDKVQVIIDKVYRKCDLDERQILQALELL